MTIELHFDEINNSELAPADNKLRERAIEAALHAYAPYSHFQVGASVLLADGTIVIGNNQENIAYPSGLCAERVALFTAGANFPYTPPIAIAIIAIKNGVIQEQISPCGACRQVMIEIERRSATSLRILNCGNEQTLIVSKAADLMPLAFNFQP
ncbi:MAG: cytidine deaminase [Tannerella sp.]|jgi:cytidine deaminase|nr:cytidine deaminase [Tannerella sp.]